MPRGGARAGAGRPKGQGKYGEDTTPVRIPNSLIDQIKPFIEHRGYRLAVYQEGDNIDSDITPSTTLHQLTHHHRDQIALQVTGQHLVRYGIHEGDVLIADKTQKPKAGKLVIIRENQQLYIRQLWLENGQFFLQDQEGKTMITPNSNLSFWGRVTHSIRAL